MQRLPRNSCNDMLQNGDFEFGESSFLRQNHGGERFVMASDSKNGDGEYSLHYKQLDEHRWNYVYQVLDTGCFAEGQRFGISAQFKIADAYTNEPHECDINSTWGDDICPYVYLRGKFGKQRILAHLKSLKKEID